MGLAGGIGWWAWPLAVLALLVVGTWVLVALMTSMPGRSYAGGLAPLMAEQTALRDTLRVHVEKLAAEIGERNVSRLAELEAAAKYIREEFERAGYAVREQPFAAARRTVRNLEAELAGGKRLEEIVVIGAHYDSVFGAPGANDNASGVAALLALAHKLRGSAPARTVRFVAFANEEPPYFLSWEMGSRQYARAAKQQDEKIVAMLSLETIGYYSDQPGSQGFPLPFRMGYPDTGNFIAFVGNLGSRALVRQAVGSFREHAQFPSEGIAAPGWIPGIGWSDHWSFWQEGYAAVMVTDTALYRYPQYHTTRDLPDALDYERMARVVDGLARVVTALSQSK